MSEQRVWIAQCLCPDRHCILAAADVAESVGEATEALLHPLERMLKRPEAIGMNPWCGLCNASSATWRYEIKRTPFTTLAAAAPMLLRLQAEQAAVRAAWGDIKRND